MTGQVPSQDPHRPRIHSVNVGHSSPNPFQRVENTGFVKLPQTSPVEVRAPGPKKGGLGSGVVGDFIGEPKHHGGDEQALYAFCREDLDRWEERLGRGLPDGAFGENLTTVGIDVNASRLGERWRIGDEVEVQVTVPRTPCATFRGFMQERGWLKTFTKDQRPGSYLRILRPGFISRGDDVHVVHVPDHEVTISLAFRALTTEQSLVPQLAAAGDDLSSELRALLKRKGIRPGTTAG